MTLSDLKNTHILFRTASHNLYLNYPDRNEVKSVGDCMHFHVNDTIGSDAYQASLFVVYRKMGEIWLYTLPYQTGSS